ncbi:MAG: hypothetical protein GEU91_00005 [Rhizobiales bacterium]|nr:hypothetical protein [Hyphomicrobiales bacterium]
MPNQRARMRRGIGLIRGCCVFRARRRVGQAVARKESPDVHRRSFRLAVRGVSWPASVDGELDRDDSWAETTITIVVATVTILFVSFVAVLMAMA